MAAVSRQYVVQIGVVDNPGEEQDTAFVQIVDVNNPPAKTVIDLQKVNWKLGDASVLPDFAASQIAALVRRTMIEGGIAPEAMGVREPGGNIA